MLNILCDGNKHTINITKYLLNNKNKYLITKTNAWGNLEPFVNLGMFDFYANEKDEIFPCIKMKENTIDYDIEYGFDGEDEYPIETTTEKTKTKYIPINKCPFCGEDILFFVDEVIDCKEEENKLTQEIDILKKRKRLSKKDYNNLGELLQKLADLRKDDYLFKEIEILIEDSEYEIYIEEDF